MQAPHSPPSNLCLDTNRLQTLQFVEALRRQTSEGFVKRGKVAEEFGGLPVITGYTDFAVPRYISTAAAVILTAEFERLGAIQPEIPPTVNLHLWNDDVFRKLYQLGFFEIVGFTPKRPDVVIDEGETRTMRIVSAKNADDLARIDQSLQNLGAFLNPSQKIPDEIIIDLLTGLSEAMSNVTAHAYPEDFHPPYQHIKGLWVAATADRSNNSLTIVIYDQGATIPFTYPRLSRLDKVVRYLGRTLHSKREFDFQDDGTYIRAAMRYGGSRTDLRHRGKGLPQMVDVIERSGSGTMTVYSRGGWCRRDSRGRFRSGAVSSSLGGTLIEWSVELS
ncbi:hypothetical protein [Rhizobium miluonense]|uniref:Histidine kinase/HSP90-like ATPase domain-containing protein n=1 Tax=Rhizobium miluonense TaxID=411945 RepID=A0ABU1SMJ6_9HYPH|nr:hypothetical protein [Rhizobium miluonense]MDR6900197.1 hypothetical protein [Rhizobium miluonense]